MVLKCSLGCETCSYAAKSLKSRKLNPQLCSQFSSQLIENSAFPARIDLFTVFIARIGILKKGKGKIRPIKSIIWMENIVFVKFYMNKRGHSMKDFSNMG